MTSVHCFVSRVSLSFVAISAISTGVEFKLESGALNPIHTPSLLSSSSAPSTPPVVIVLSTPCASRTGMDDSWKRERQATGEGVVERVVVRKGEEGKKGPDDASTL
jgi:hypothetical protein